MLKENVFFLSPHVFYPLTVFKILDRFYTPLYEKGIKENQNKPMDITNDPKICKRFLHFLSMFVYLLKIMKSLQRFASEISRNFKIQI